MSRVLVISEKPTAARRIADALDDENDPKEITKGKVSYFECKRGSDAVRVVHALGHLFELRQTEAGWAYPRLETQWVPRDQVDKKAEGVGPIINLIRRLSKETDEFVVATDYDIEGSLIGYLTLKYACNADTNKAKRMLFSSLTRSDVLNAYLNPMPTLDFPVIESGYVRHQVDWLYGINLTRALTLAIKRAAGWFKIVSTGRVQGPALAHVAAQERRINLFVPTPFWKIAVLGGYSGSEFGIEYSKGRIAAREEAHRIVSELSGRVAEVLSVHNRRVSLQPPEPFNLSTLQSEAYRHFGFKPSKTLQIAQKLYLDALISYPRTNSQQIPPSVDVKKILQELQSSRTYSKLVRAILEAGRLVPRQGERSDSAHPAIHPTGQSPAKRLQPNEDRVYDLVVRRFLSAFGSEAVRESLRADLGADGHLLHVRGIRTLEEGWMEFYDPYAHKSEVPLPPLRVGGRVQLVSVEANRSLTSPPPRYNPASLMRVLEKENLGTKATRAGILDSLKSRGYTLNDQFEMSTLGYSTFETLEKYVPRILSAEFTRGLEKQMEDIQSHPEARDSVLSEAKRDLLEMLLAFQSREELIGTELVAGLKRYWREKEELGTCPKCNEGVLRIIRSPKSGKMFVGCSGYREGKCDQTFPLPQRGTIVPLETSCEFCGHRMIKVLSGRRTWETCINWVRCPGRQEEIKNLETRRAKSGGGKRTEEGHNDE